MFVGAAKWSRQFDDTPSTEPVAYLAWDRWIAVLRRINERVTLPELPAAIEEFAIDHQWQIEVTFERAIG